MIDFSNKYNNSISYYGIGAFWQGIAKPKPVVTIASNFNFYGGIGFLQDWNAKAITPTGVKTRLRTLLGAGI